MESTLDHAGSNVSSHHTHEISITGDGDSHSNQYFIDYCEICSDNITNAYNASSYFFSDMLNISSDIYSNSNNNNNNSNNINNFTHHNNNNNNSTKNYIDTLELYYMTIYKYYAPILVCTGSIGNILSIIVFFKTKLRKLSSSHYLAALAISDTCFLLVVFVNWLEYLEILDVFSRDIFCKFHTFLQYLTCFCSDWFVVAFTVERFIAVLYPLKRQTMCTVRRAKIVLFCLTIVGCIHCAPFWFLSTININKNRSICSVDPKYGDIMKILNYWDSFIVLAVPFILIAILNTWTGCTVWKFATVRRTLTMQKRKDTMKTSSIVCNSNNVPLSTYPPKRQNSTCLHPSGQNYISHQHHHHHHGCEPRKQSAKRKLSNSSQMKVTKMLMVVSTVFVCLNLPSCVMRIKIYLEYSFAEQQDNTGTTVVLQHYFELLFITNFGINFVLYCVSGQNFRKAVLSMFRHVSQTQREGTGTTQVTVSEYHPGNGTSSRRRLMSHNCWNEHHELQTII